MDYNQNKEKQHEATKAMWTTVLVVFLVIILCIIIFYYWTSPTYNKTAPPSRNHHHLVYSSYRTDRTDPTTTTATSPTTPNTTGTTYSAQMTSSTNHDALFDFSSPMIPANVAYQISVQPMQYTPLQPMTPSGTTSQINTVPTSTSSNSPTYQLSNSVEYTNNQLNTDITNPPYPFQGTEAQCESQCSSTKNCLGFSWEKVVPTSQVGPCYLKQNFNGAMTSNDPTWETYLSPAGVTALQALAPTVSVAQ